MPRRHRLRESDRAKRETNFENVREQRLRQKSRRQLMGETYARHAFKAPAPDQKETER
jgi:hypothetical protein